MDLNLPAEANDFVKSLVAQGKYQSKEAAVVDGIRLLKSREDLRSKIAIGIDQLDRGESVDDESVFEEVEAEIVKIEASRKREQVDAKTSVFGGSERGSERSERDRSIHCQENTSCREAMDNETTQEVSLSRPKPEDR